LDVVIGSFQLHIVNMSRLSSDDDDDTMMIPITFMPAAVHKQKKQKR
jgi:hypothetical protein